MASESARFDSRVGDGRYMCVLPIEHFGLCPVCLKEYEDPIWLKCCHTVCRRCLQTRDGQLATGYESVVCPMCRFATHTNENGLEGLMVDTFAKKIAELSKLKKSKLNLNKIKCSGECMQGGAKAIVYCLECCVFLCQLDYKIHQKLTRDTHTTIPLKELVAKPTNDLLLKAAPMRCTYHTDVEATYYCLTSQLLLCAQCKSAHNPNHHMEVLKSHLNKLTEQTRDNLTSHREESEKVQGEEVTQWRKMKELKDQVESSFDRLIFRLETRKKDLMSKLNTIIEETRHTLDLNRKKMAQLDHLKELLLVKSRYPKDVFMLHSITELNKHFQDQLNKTRAEHGVPYKDLHFDLDSSVQVCLDSLGRFQVTQSIKPVTIIKDPSPTQQQGGFHPYSIEVSTQGVFVLISGTPCVVMVFTHAGELLKTIKLDQQGEEAISFGGLTVTERMLAVVVTSKHCVQTYSHEGELLKVVGKLGHSQLEFNTPIGITSTEEGHLIVADSRNNRLQVFTPQLEFSHFIGSSNSVPGELRYPADVSVNKINQIVCLHQGSPSIHIYSFTGMLLSQFGSTINGNELHCPVRLAISQTGNIVVVDRSKPCLTVYGPDNSILVRLVGMYNEVWGIAFSPQNRLFVCDTDHIKVLNLQAFEMFGPTRHSSLPGETKRSYLVSKNGPSISDV